MGLETATLINQLVPTNPVHTDYIGQADAHIRMLKTVLQTQFPNLVNPVTATDSQLNNNLIPSGVICMWSGSLASIPTGWVLCNGLNGTPDLRNLFVIGAGSTYAPGNLGGAASAAVQTDEQGYHSHTGITNVAGGHTHASSSDVQGYHDHGGGTGLYALTTNEIPPHTHTVQGSMLDGDPGAGVTLSNAAFVGSGAGYVVNNEQTGSTGAGNGHNHSIPYDGSHNHNISVTSVGDHQHGISGDALHAHNVTVATMPPFCALAFIMKT